MDNNLYWELLVGQIAPIIIAFLGAVIAWCIKRLAFEIKEHVSYFKCSVERQVLLDAILEAVNNTNRIFVSSAKTIAEDGKLTTEEKEKAKQLAKMELDRVVTDPSLKKLMISLGEGFIDAAIEAAVRKLK